jgi:hypothetical protein
MFEETGGRLINGQSNAVTSHFLLYIIQWHNWYLELLCFAFLQDLPVLDLGKICRGVCGIVERVFVS